MAGLGLYLKRSAFSTRHFIVKHCEKNSSTFIKLMYYKIFYSSRLWGPSFENKIYKTITIFREINFTKNFVKLISRKKPYKTICLPVWELATVETVGGVGDDFCCWLATSCWSSEVLCWFSCCCFFLTNCSADFRSSKVTPWVDLRVSRTLLAWAFLWVSDSSSRTGGTNDLK